MLGSYSDGILDPTEHTKTDRFESPAREALLGYTLTMSTWLAWC